LGAFNQFEEKEGGIAYHCFEMEWFNCVTKMDDWYAVSIFS